MSGLTEQHRGPKEQAFQGSKSLSGSQTGSLCHGGGLGKDLHGGTIQRHPEMSHQTVLEYRTDTGDVASADAATKRVAAPHFSVFWAMLSHHLMGSFPKAKTISEAFALSPGIRK